VLGISVNDTLLGFFIPPEDEIRFFRTYEEMQSHHRTLETFYNSYMRMAPWGISAAAYILRAVTMFGPMISSSRGASSLGYAYNANFIAFMENINRTTGGPLSIELVPFHTHPAIDSQYDEIKDCFPIWNVIVRKALERVASADIGAFVDWVEQNRSRLQYVRPSTDDVDQFRQLAGDKFTLPITWAGIANERLCSFFNISDSPQVEELYERSETMRIPFFMPQFVSGFPAFVESINQILGQRSEVTQAPRASRRRSPSGAAAQRFMSHLRSELKKDKYLPIPEEENYRNGFLSAYLNYDEGMVNERLDTRCLRIPRYLSSSYERELESGRCLYKISIDTRCIPNVILDNLFKPRDGGPAPIRGFYSFPLSDAEWLRLRSPVTIYVLEGELSDNRKDELKALLTEEFTEKMRLRNATAFAGEEIAPGLSMEKCPDERSVRALIGDSEKLHVELGAAVREFMDERDTGEPQPDPARFRIALEAVRQFQAGTRPLSCFERPLPGAENFDETVRSLTKLLMEGDAEKIKTAGIRLPEYFEDHLIRALARFEPEDAYAMAELLGRKAAPPDAPVKRPRRRLHYRSAASTILGALILTSDDPDRLYRIFFDTLRSGIDDRINNLSKAHKGDVIISGPFSDWDGFSRTISQSFEECLYYFPDPSKWSRTYFTDEFMAVPRKGEGYVSLFDYEERKALAGAEARKWAADAGFVGKEGLVALVVGDSGEILTTGLPHLGYVGHTHPA
ncbi:hypothetical protein ACFL42_05255, partial [Candidatus Omnitrophota bacterium]